MAIPRIIFPQSFETAAFYGHPSVLFRPPPLAYWAPGVGIIPLNHFILPHYPQRTRWRTYFSPGGRCQVSPCVIGFNTDPDAKLPGRNGKCCLAPIQEKLKIIPHSKPNCQWSITFSSASACPLRWRSIADRPRPSTLAGEPPEPRSRWHRSFSCECPQS